MKFGVRVGMLAASWDGIYEQAATLGFDGVELEVGRDAPEQGTPLFDPGERDNVKNRTAACGAATSSACIGALWKYSPASPDETLRETGLQLVKNTITACRDLGADRILLPLSNVDQPPEVSVPRWVEFLKEASAAAQAEDVVLAVEACARPGLGTAEDLRALVDQVGSNHVRAYFDVANLHAAGTDPVQGLGALGSEYIAIIHIKDRKKNPAGSDRAFSSCPLGEGVLDFQAITDTIREIGYDDWLVLETPGGDDRNASAKRNLEYIKAFFP